MKKLRFYLAVIRIHAEHGGVRQAASYAVRHWRFWAGAEKYTDEPYVHIGHR